MDEETLDGLLIYAQVTSRNLRYVYTIAQNIKHITEREDIMSRYTLALINCLNEYISKTDTDMRRLQDFIISLRHNHLNM